MSLALDQDSQTVADCTAKTWPADQAPAYLRRTPVESTNTRTRIHRWSWPIDGALVPPGMSPVMAPGLIKPTTTGCRERQRGRLICCRNPSLRVFKKAMSRRFGFSERR